MNQEPKFYNKNGDLSKYSFTCGYIQRKEKDNKKVQLFYETPAYHVQYINYSLTNGSAPAWNEDKNIKAWYTLDSLTEARNKYKELCTKHVMNY